MNNHNDLSLLNYEGDVLKLKKLNDDAFAIHDQWDTVVEILTHDKVLEFIDGSRNIIDSSGKSWNWPEAHREAKPTSLRIYEYLKS